MMKQETRSKYKDRRYSIQEYDIEWSKKFKIEADKLKSIFQKNIVAIEHVGSTAVPGLASKPTIDILILVENINVVEKIRSAMDNAGYKFLGEYVKKGAFLFVRERNNIRLCNIHVFQSDDLQAKEMLDFKNYLNQNSEIIKEYSKLKMDLFEKYPDDYCMYRKFKDAWMEKMLKKIF